VAVFSYKTEYEKHNTHIVDISRLSNETSLYHDLLLNIRNQSGTTLYYKVSASTSGWYVNYPTDGELGSINSGSARSFRAQIVRSSIPSANTAETVTVAVEAYSDSGYTNKVGELSFDLTFVYIDSSAETEVQRWDFDDGTEQGWSITADSGSYYLSDTYSLSAGGYSVYFPSGSSPNGITLSRGSVSIPATNRVVLLFYTMIPSTSSFISKILVKVNGETLYDFTSEGGSVTIEIYIKLGSSSEVYIDEITIVGTDNV